MVHAGLQLFDLRPSKDSNIISRVAALSAELLLGGLSAPAWGSNRPNSQCRLVLLKAALRLLGISKSHMICSSLQKEQSPRTDRTLLCNTANPVVEPIDSESSVKKSVILSLGSIEALEVEVEAQIRDAEIQEQTSVVDTDLEIDANIGIENMRVAITSSPSEEEHSMMEKWRREIEGIENMSERLLQRYLNTSRREGKEVQQIRNALCVSPHLKCFRLILSL